VRGGKKKRIVKIVFGKRIKLSFFCQAKDNTHTHTHTGAANAKPKIEKSTRKMRKMQPGKIFENQFDDCGLIFGCPPITFQLNGLANT